MPYSIPALLLGLIVVIYWARVLKMVLKQRRKTGRDANFVPRETLGKLLRIFWYPAVVLWIVVPFLISLTSIRFAGLQLYPLPSTLAWAGVTIAAVCLILTWICWKKMGKSWRMGIDPTEKTQLVVSGPYAYVRHPIYALQIVLAAVSIVIVPALTMLIVCSIIIVFLYWEARREEQYLLGVHGDIYRLFMKNVGGFFPHSLVPYQPQSPSV
jgi:protein-S-isoprenylcysteine O-methyltransferase Ste14